MKSEQDQLLCQRIAGEFSPTPPYRLGVAVSGGSDSLALMYLLHEWHELGGPVLHVATVDHGLRPGSAEEAKLVAAHAEGLGISHDCLLWEGWDGEGNLQDQARRARYRLLQNWAAERGISHVALGHTADDQAETFLMRLAREAGVDGLSAMSRSRRVGPVIFCRPALRITREELRDELRNRNVSWVDDPSNEDETFDRVRARKILTELSRLGITAGTLTAVTRQMSEVRRTLYWYVFLAAREMVSFQHGDLLIERKGFRVLQREVSRRLMQTALNWVSGAEYPPRGRAMELLLESIRGGTGMTLHGCRIIVETSRIRITREHSAVAKRRMRIGEIWDSRWRLTGPVSHEGLELGALGPEGLLLCPDWKNSGIPEASQLSGPAVWRGGELVAAPLAGLGNGWMAELVYDEEDYFASLLSQ